MKMLYEIEDKKWFSFKGIGIAVLMLAIYFGVPQLVGGLFYYKLGLPEMLSVFIGNIVVALIFFLMFMPLLIKHFKEYASSFSDSFHDSLKFWGIGLGIMVVTNLILNVFVFPGEIAENEELNRSFLGLYPLIGFFEVSLLAPFIEEMIFRFALRKAWGYNKYYPLISGLVFGLLHALTGINSISDLPYLLYTIPYGALGYAFGYAYNKSNNIFSSMVCHFLHNTMCFVFIVLAV